MSRSVRALSSLVLLTAWGSAPAPADGRTEAPIDVRIESVTPAGYRAVVTLPEPLVLHGDVFGQRLAEITIPGGAFENPPGTPQLPTLSLLLSIPWGVEPRLAASPGDDRALGHARPVPVPHLLSARGAWSTLGAAEIEGYLGSAGYRASAAGGRSDDGRAFASAAPTAAGAERVLHVTIRPIRWDARTGEARAFRRAVLDVAWDRSVLALPEAGDTGTGRRSVPRSGAHAALFGPRYPAGGPVAAARPGSAARGSGGVSGAPARASAYAGPIRVEPTRPWVRLGVLRPGLYALSPADLATAGVSLAGVDPATFRIFRASPGDLPESVLVDSAPDSLRECSIVVTGEGDGVFDPGDRICVYATGSTGFGYDLERDGSINYEEAERSDEESLWLTWGAGPVASPPRRMPTRAAAPVSPATVVTSAPHRVHFEENRVRDFNLVSSSLRWERWFYRLMTQGSRIAFPLTLPGAEPGGQGSIVLRMWGKGISIGASLDDHYTNLYWNGSPIASASWNFSLPQDLAASGFPVDGLDTLEVAVPRLVDLDDPGRFDQSDLAWFEVSYPRRLLAINDTLQFTADTTLGGLVHFALSGISDTTAVWFLDRTDPENPVRLVNGAYSGAAPPYSFTAQDTLVPGTPRRYALVSTARALRPPAVVRYAPPSSAHAIDNLLDPSNGADYVIVVPPSLLAEAESLAVFRAGRLSGFGAPRIAIATTDRIAAQFGAGYLEPTSIRNFLGYARAQWAAPALTYVCLFGDASLDPKNYLGFGAPDHVPAYGRYFDTLHKFVSDDYYGFLDGVGDQILDVAIGRLPAKTAAEALVLTRGKTQSFEAAFELDPWRARALLCADDSWKREQRDVLGNGHVMEMERKDRQHLPYPIERSKVYLNDYAFADTTHQSKPAAREELIARINQGNWLVDYIGHGSDVVIADEQAFRSSDVGRLTNAARPSIFGFFSCTVGQFDALGQEGLGELLLKLPAGGAAASLAATELVFPSESTTLNDEFVDQLFPLTPRVDSTLTVGLAWARAKNAHVNSVVRKYVLLGDPGLMTPIPKGRGVWETSPVDSLLRGELAVVRGHALNPDSTPDTLATGTALIQVQGKPFQRVQIGLNSLNTLVPFPYEVPGPVIYRGAVTLDRGSFTVRFVVPLDVRVAGARGQLRALLSEAGGRGVGLAVDSMRIAQTVGSRTDLTPPSITLLYPAGSDSTVQPGDRLTIAIEDSSGVDLLRLDNAHTIFVIVDDRGSPMELTPGFTYDAGSHSRGTVPYVVPQLSEGLHRIEVHASDAFGNIGVRTFVLDVHAPAQPGDPMQLSQVFNYPNPFEGVTYVHARLNQGARLRVQILTVSGRRVRDLESDGRAGENFVPWDGKDSAGENVAIGVYLIRVTAESSGGRRASAVGRALKTR